ncbi:MAG: NAD(P)H dehydrogenase (quinone) [Kiritimatiellia bacterium]
MGGGFMLLGNRGFFFFCKVDGMFWVGIDVAHSTVGAVINRLGGQLGVIAHSENGEINDIYRNTAVYLASRIAKIV